MCVKLPQSWQWPLHASHCSPAVIDDKHGTKDRGSVTEFPPLVVVAAAQATRLQLDGLEILKNSVRAEASIGGLIGIEFATMLESDQKLDRALALIVKTERVHNQMPIWETTASVLPILPFVLNLARRYHNPPSTAQAISLVDSHGHLAIAAGMEAFSAALDAASQARDGSHCRC
jgi:hypothetical protein